jgi:hypothetical protein
MNPTLRFHIARYPDGYRIYETGVLEPIAILQSLDAAERSCEELNRGIVESANVAPDGRWTEPKEVA